MLHHDRRSGAESQVTLFRSALDALKVVESLKTRGVKLHALGKPAAIADELCFAAPMFWALD